MSFIHRFKVWQRKLGVMLFNDVPLIVFVILVQALIVALRPGQYGDIHFAKALFFTALVKALWIGITISLLSFNKRLIKWIFCMLNVLLFEVYFYLLLQFNVRFNPFILSLILQTNAQETREFFMSFFPLRTELYLLFSALALFFIYHIFNFVWKKIIKNKKIPRHFLLITTSLFVLSLSLYTIYNDPYGVDGSNVSTPKTSNKNSILPLHIIRNAELAFMEIKTAINVATQKANKEIIQKIYQANEDVEIDSCKFTSPHIVFIIGESFIKYHSSLYGYRHETNPCLKSELKKGNLFVFSDVIAHSGDTSSAMQFFYSTKSVDDDKVWEEQPLFPAIFKKAGYCVSLFDNQSTRASGSDVYDYSSSFFINPNIIHNQCFDYRNEKTFPYDLEMIEYESDKIKKNHTKRTITILHLYGQHVFAGQRYPNTKEYTFFTRDSIKREDLGGKLREMVSQYDNATRYNDLVVNRILDLYRDTDAVVVYVSDHGDCVYDDSAITFGRHIGENPSDEGKKLLLEVPMFIWCSDKYKEKHPDIVKRISCSVDRPFMHDDICHVLFDLAGLYTSHYDPSRSVINEKFKTKKRIIPNGHYDYNAIKPRLDKIRLRTENN